MTRRWLADLAIALVLGGTVAAGAVGVLHAGGGDDGPSPEQVRADLDDSDRVVEVLAGLRDDGVHVTDDGRYLLDEAGEEAVAAAVAAEDEPVYVLVWAEDQQVGADENDVLAHLEDELDDRGVLIVFGGPRAGASTVEVLGDRGGYTPIYGDDLTGDPATTLPAAVAAAAQVDYYDLDEDDGELGVVGGAILGVLLGLGLAGLGLIFVRAARFGRGPIPGRWGWRTRS